MSCPALPYLALLTLLSVAGTEGELCLSEMNLIKDLLQANCSGQGLSAVPSALPNTTGILLLNTNHLASVSTASFQHLPELVELDLSDNGLRTLHMGATLPLLQELILSHNTLGVLPRLQALPNLTRLAVAYNSITELLPGTFQAVRQLKLLNLRGNRLRTLPEKAFKGLAQLRELDLSDNALEELPQGLLAGLELETLWLSGNQLRSLPDDFFPDGHLFPYVFLAGNPWNCDCGLAYLRDWITDNEFSVYIQEQMPNGLVTKNDPHSPVCDAPTNHQGIPVLNFKQDCSKTGDIDVNGELDEDGDRDEIIREEGTSVPSTIASFTTLPPMSSLPLAPSTILLPTTSITPTDVPSTTLPPTISMPPSTVPSTILPPTTVPETTSPAPPQPLSTAIIPAAIPPLTGAPPLCLCPTPPAVMPMVGHQQGREGPQWGQWVRAHCCLLRLVLYVACLVLLLLPMLALVAWMCWMYFGWYYPALKGPPGAQLVQYELLRKGEQAAPTLMHFSSFKSPTEPPTFCTTKELEIHYNPPVASCRRVTKRLLSVGGLGPWRAPSAYSLDRGEAAIGAVRVKYATTTM